MDKAYFTGVANHHNPLDYWHVGLDGAVARFSNRYKAIDYLLAVRDGAVWLHMGDANEPVLLLNMSESGLNRDEATDLADSRLPA